MQVLKLIPWVTEGVDSQQILFYFIHGLSIEPWHHAYTHHDLYTNTSVHVDMCERETLEFGFEGHAVPLQTFLYSVGLREMEKGRERLF